MQGGFVRLTKDFDPTMAIMGRLQRGYTIEGSVAEAELLLPSDAKLILQVQETLAYAKAAESEL